MNPEVFELIPNNRRVSSIELRDEFICDFAVDSNIDAPSWLPRGGTYRDDTIVSAWNLRGKDWYINAAPGPKAAPDAQAPKRGGSRKGAGRKPLDTDGTMVTTIRLTGKQKATFDMLGGKDWLRGQLDLFA